MRIAERDWKVFKEVRERALERFSQRILDQAQAICRDDTQTAHERYGRLYGLIRERDREMAMAFDDFRRSTAVQCLRLMMKLELLDDDDLARFSHDLEEDLRM